MILQTSISDFVNSKYCRKETCRISACPVRKEQMHYDFYKRLIKRIGIDIRVVWSGRQDLRNYARSLIPNIYYRCAECDEIVEMRFEDFRIFFVYVPGLEKHENKRTHLSGLGVFIDCNLVMLPRKTPLQTMRGEMIVHDKYFAHLYVFPELEYPKEKDDLRRMMLWLRLKQVLAVRYRIPEQKVIRFDPSFASFKTWYWWKHIIIRTRNDDLEPEYQKLLEPDSNVDNSYPNTFIDFRNNKLIFTSYTDVTIYPVKPITQDLINEFLRKERNRYKVYR